MLAAFYVFQTVRSPLFSHVIVELLLLIMNIIIMNIIIIVNKLLSCLVLNSIVLVCLVAS